MEDVWAACDAANVTEFVRTFPNGLHTFIGAENAFLSHFYAQDDLFAKTGSGNTQEKLRIKALFGRREGGETLGGAEAAACDRSCDHSPPYDSAAGRGDECAGLCQREGGAEGALFSSCCYRVLPSCPVLSCPVRFCPAVLACPFALLLFDRRHSCACVRAAAAWQALDEMLKRHRGVAIVIAHRLTTIKNCDKIIVMVRYALRAALH
jgi:hypothetical protein